MTEDRKIVVMAATAASMHGLIALVTNSYRIFFGAFGPSCVIGMVEIFFAYAVKATNGEVPYRDYLIEYPILAFPIFMIPRLCTSSFSGYRLAFGVELLLFNAVAVLLVARHVADEEGMASVPPRLAWYTVFFATLCPLLMGPYDLAPMAVAFAAADTWFYRRNALGGFLAGVGVLVKIFPGAVAAPALVCEIVRLRESRGRGIVTFLGTIAAGASFWFWMGGIRAAKSVLYHAERGLEVGSLYAGVLMLIAKVEGKRATLVYNHKALHISPEWGDHLARFVLPIQLAAILLVMWQYWRSGMRDGVRYAGAAVLGFMVTSKVLSPQFLIWLIPFVSVLSGETGRRARRLYLLACIATTMIYPHIGLKFIIEDNSLSAILLLNYRNATLVSILLLLLFAKEGAADPRGEAL